LVSGEMNDDRKYPCAQWSSSQSNPASAARFVAATKSALIRARSSWVAARAVCEMPGRYCRALAATSGQLPLGSG
jgi:hypothetical protein